MRQGRPNRGAEHLLSRIQRGDLAIKRVPGPIETLSPREQQVLRLIAGGKTGKEIANLLDMKLQTVRTYRKTLMKKLGVESTARASFYIYNTQEDVDALVKSLARVDQVFGLTGAKAK